MAGSIKTINLEQAERCMAVCFAANIPIMLISPPGVGKSFKVREVRDKLNAEVMRKWALTHSADVTDLTGEQPKTWSFYDFRLSDKQKEDLGGIPFPNERRDAIKYLMLETLPFDTDEYCIIFFDEVDRAEVEMQNVMQQFLIDRAINGHPISPNARIVLAGNGVSDIGTTPLTGAVINRIDIVYIEWGTEGARKTWDAWAAETDPLTGEQNASDMLRGFAEFNHDVFANGHAQTSYEEIAFASPRSWVAADYVLRICEQVNFRTSDILHPLVHGLVGEKGGTEFLAFRDLHKHAPSVAEIINDPKGTQVPARPDILYVLGNALCDHAMREKDHAEAAAIYGSRWPEEPKARFMRQLLKKQPAVAITPAFNKWNAGQLSESKQRQLEDTDPWSGAAPINTGVPVIPPSAKPVTQPTPQVVTQAVTQAPVATLPNRDFMTRVLAAYPGATPMPDSNEWINRVRITADSGANYVLSQHRDSGEEACGCPAWTRKIQRPCKHLKALK